MRYNDWIHWTQWDDSGVSASGEMRHIEVLWNLRRSEKRAREVMKETGADHVVYARKMYGDDGRLVEVRFYMIPMDDARFYRDIATISNSQIYAVHKLG